MAPHTDFGTQRHVHYQPEPKPKPKPRPNPSPNPNPKPESRPEPEPPATAASPHSGLRKRLRTWSLARGFGVATGGCERAAHTVSGRLCSSTIRSAGSPCSAE
jgi:hypothetical protein